MKYPSSEFSIHNYLTYEQVQIIKNNFQDFDNYVDGKKLHELFLVRNLNINEIDHTSTNFGQMTLLEKIICVRRFLK